VVETTGEDRWRASARDGSSEWQVVYQSHQRAEARLDEAEDSQTDEGGRVVEIGPRIIVKPRCLNPSISFSAAHHASLSLL
jgi:hypothetical protein